MAEAAKKAQQLEALKKQICERVILFENKEGSKLVDLKEIPTLVRSLGFNPTGTQANMVSELCMGQQGRLREKHSTRSTGCSNIEVCHDACPHILPMGMAKQIIDQLASLNADSTLIPMEHVETVVSNYLVQQVGGQRTAGQQI